MRCVLLTLVFALSVSARCVRKNVPEQAGPTDKKPVEVTGATTFGVTKQAAQNGKTVFTNGTSPASPSGDQGSNSGSSGSGDSTTTPSESTSGDQGSDSASSGSGDSSTTSSSGSTSGDQASGGAASGSSNSNNASSNSPAGSGVTSSGGGSGNCGRLKGVCFNGGMKASMYDMITTATDWITFNMTIPGGGASPRTQKDYVPMMPFKDSVADAVKLVNGPNAPEWLLTFNEPDFSYNGPGYSTPTMSPQDAAEAIKPLLAQPGSGTKFVAPGPMNPTGNWLPDFFAACNCQNFFSAYNIHQYQPTSQAVINTITEFRGKFSDKPIWITEVAPGAAGCGLGLEKVGQFMKEMYKFAKDSGYVDRVFWNSGNKLDHMDTNVCESWLVDADRFLDAEDHFGDGPPTCKLPDMRTSQRQLGISNIIVKRIRKNGDDFSFSFHPSKASFAMAFTLSSLVTHQPFKTIYILAALLYTLFLLPLWLLFYLSPALRQHPSYTYRQALMVRLVKVYNSPASRIRSHPAWTLAPGSEGQRFTPIPPSGKPIYRGELDDPEVKPARIGGTWYPTVYDPASTEEQGKKPGTVILHIHGGAFVICEGRFQDLAYGARLLNSHTHNARVFGVQYRLSSLGARCRFPAALQDVVTAYQHLLDLGVPAASIVVSGDSAGGNLAIAFLRYVTAEHPGVLPAPAAALLWSPWTRPATAMLPRSCSGNPRYGTDFLEDGFLEWGVRAYAPPGSGVDPDGP
ncbi:MAG: hypothetical protein Q9173_005662, partial [Seirophora scorigena]